MVIRLLSTPAGLMQSDQILPQTDSLALKIYAA